MSHLMPECRLEAQRDSSTPSNPRFCSACCSERRHCDKVFGELPYSANDRPGSFPPEVLPRYLQQ